MLVIPLALTLAFGGGGLQANTAPEGSPSPGFMGTFKSSETGKDSLQLQLRLGKQAPAKLSPMHNWSFDYRADGFAVAHAGSSFNLRFRTYFQDPGVDPLHENAQWATRMLLRLWDFNFYRLGFDNDFLNSSPKVIDVYLCREGDPGGEQRFDHDPKGSDTKVNTIYIYKLAQFPTPLELSRELAHEFGHATLPQVHGYDAPEDYASGQLGERLYLKWVYDCYLAKTLNQDDAVGASVASVRGYVEAKVTPLVRRIATSGPNIALLKGRSEKSFYEYVALVMYAEAVIPRIAFQRSLRAGLGSHGDAYEAQLLQAISEVSSWDVKIPPGLRQKVFYIPLAKGAVTGAKILGRHGAWVKIMPTSSRVFVINPPVK